MLSRRCLIKSMLAFSAASSLPLWSRAVLPDSLPLLPVPSLLQSASDGKILLKLQRGKMHWLPGIATNTWGINGPFFGPALRLRRGQAVSIEVINALLEPTTIHWHGLEIPGAADGSPQALIAPASKRDISFVVDQPAATCWFHPHPHGKTGHQVAMGLGGMVIIDDEFSDKLPLPKRWGVDDIPVILQDKRLSQTGQIDYQLDVMTASVGWFGDILLTNGARYPQHSVPRGWVRLRLLNACNARSLNLATSDARPLYVIASDGGFLPEPVALRELFMLPGERFEVLLNTLDGHSFDLVTLPVQQIAMTLPPFDRPLSVLRIQPSVHTGSKVLPDRLALMPALPEQQSLPNRWFQLMMDPQLDRMGMQELVMRYGAQAMSAAHMDHHNMADTASHHEHEKVIDFRHANRINGQPFSMTAPAFDAKRGQLEKWTISGEGDMMLHPFHVHGTQYRILMENGQLPAAHRSGWKDTVRVEGARSEILVRFNRTASAEYPYMAHCHLLEHEDTGMMLGFTVSA